MTPPLLREQGNGAPHENERERGKESIFEEPLVESKKKTEEPSKAEFKSKREMTNPFVISRTRSDESCKPSPLIPPGGTKSQTRRKKEVRGKRVLENCEESFVL